MEARQWLLGGQCVQSIGSVGPCYLRPCFAVGCMVNGRQGQDVVQEQVGLL